MLVPRVEAKECRSNDIEQRYTKFIIYPFSKKIMKTKMILAILAIGVLGASLTGKALADNGLQPWQHALSGGILTFGEKTSLLWVVAPTEIPRHTDLFTGYAWLYDDGPWTAIVAVTHKGVVDSMQDPNSWHPHNVKLAIGQSKGSDACIVTLQDNDKAGLTIFANYLGMHVRDSELTGHLSGKVTAFEIVPDNGCASKLGVNLS